MRVSDLRIHESLSIVAIDGFEPKVDTTDPSEPMAIDAPGSANWLLEDVGVIDDIQEDNPAGSVLWSDYENSTYDPWRFSVLIDSDDVDEVTETCKAHGYQILSVKALDAVIVYGDSQQGTVAICQHPDGWIVIRS